MHLSYLVIPGTSELSVCVAASNPELNIVGCESCCHTTIESGKWLIEVCSQTPTIKTFTTVFDISRKSITGEEAARKFYKYLVYIGILKKNIVCDDTIVH